MTGIDAAGDEQDIRYKRKTVNHELLLVNEIAFQLADPVIVLSEFY